MNSSAAEREPRHPNDRSSEAEPIAGPLVSADVGGTALFVVGAVAAAASPTTFGRAYAVLSLALFLVGCLGFLAGFWHAVQRSRVDDISLGGMLVVTHHGRPPASVRNVFIATLALQSVVALLAAALRPFTELAFGILVPMFGLGLSCLWGARFGRFPVRPDRELD